MIIWRLFFITSLPPPFVLFILLCCAALSVSFGNWCRDLGSGCWVPTVGMGWSHPMCRGLQPPNTASQETANKGRLRFPCGDSERCWTCCGCRAQHPTVLCWWSSFLCFLWRSLLTIFYFPPEKWKQFCCSSSLLEVFNGRCAAAALESWRSPLLSHHGVRERHVGLESLLRDSWTSTWLLLLWVKAESQSPLAKLVLQ